MLSQRTTTSPSSAPGSMAWSLWPAWSGAVWRHAACDNGRAPCRARSSSGGKAAAVIDILSGGRLVLGVGPGSSADDYEVVGLPFEERWSRLDEAVQVLRRHLTGSTAPFQGRFYKTSAELEPRPSQANGIPIWIGSWGSKAGLRRVAPSGDGWIASASVNECY
jgi:Luciferase-like monooxygenase